MTRLLVVDDNEQNRYMAQVLLSGSGYQVVLAANGVEALEKARKEPPDLIIADILMPTMDGFALCREWKMDEHLRSIPFIFYTATYTDPEDEKFALSIGADRFLIKPITPETLIAVIQEVLNQFSTQPPESSDSLPTDEDVYLRQYNQALIHKLEDKLAQLESANKALEEEISERKRTEENLQRIERQLLQAQKMEAIGTLAGGIAHDFNNILLAIMGYAEIALINTRQGQSGEIHIQEVLKACHRAKEMVHQILTFSRQTEIDHKPIQVKTIIKEVLKLLRSSLPATIEIQEQMVSESLILANPTQIYQVMMNLCTNAAHAMKNQSGMIQVTLSDEDLEEDFAFGHDKIAAGAYQKLTIRDNGIGMTPDHLARIFDPYFTTKEKGEGTGLGLSVVHGIVKSTGGTICVSSDPNKGTQFDLYFPIFKGEVGDVAHSFELPERGQERILFVDDEPTLAEIGTELLVNLGYQVTACRQSEDALKIFKARPNDFDLVITDMTMPVMTGDVLAKQLLQLRPDLPIILCTGFSTRITEQKAVQMGIRAFLMKPFVLRDLAKTIRNVLDNKCLSKAP